MTLSPALLRPRSVKPALLLIILIVLAALCLTTAPIANAAGSGVLNLELTPINLTNGSTITDASNGTNNNQITYRVQFSCTTAACDNTKVQLSPAPPDPHGLLPDGEWILEYATWVPPVSGGTIGRDRHHRQAGQPRQPAGRHLGHLLGDLRLPGDAGRRGAERFVLSRGLRDRDVGDSDV